MEDMLSDSRYTDGKRAHCKKCKAKQVTLRMYNLTAEEYADILQRQGNMCAICLDEFTATPHVDHDHSTGEVRGFLCSNCNRGIGLLRDDFYIVQSAADYLRR